MTSLPPGIIILAGALVLPLLPRRAQAIGALLLVIGIGLVGGAIYYKTRRDQINKIIDRWRSKLGAWE